MRAANRLAVEAVGHLETLPPSVELHLIRAEIAQSRNRNPEGVTRSVPHWRSSRAIRRSKARSRRRLLRAHDLDEAIPLLERLTREQPGDGSLLLMYGDALLQAQQLDRAIPILEQAVKAPDALAEGRALLGRAYVQAGKYQEAVPQLEASLEPDEDGDVHYQLARAYQALGRADDAQKALQEYQRRRPAAADGCPADPPNATLTPPND